MTPSQRNVLIGVSIAVIVGICAVVLVVVLRRKQPRSAGAHAPSNHSPAQQCVMPDNMTYNDIATNDTNTVQARYNDSSKNYIVWTQTNGGAVQALPKDQNPKQFLDEIMQPLIPVLQTKGHLPTGVSVCDPSKVHTNVRSSIAVPNGTRVKVYDGDGASPTYAVTGTLGLYNSDTS
jgi:hypothetical protein